MLYCNVWPVFGILLNSCMKSATWNIAQMQSWQTFVSLFLFSQWASQSKYIHSWHWKTEKTPRWIVWKGICQATGHKCEFIFQLACQLGHPSTDICIIDLVWGQDGCILPEFLLWISINRDIVEVNNNTKNNEANMQPCWLNKLAGQKGFIIRPFCFVLWDTQEIQSTQDRSMLPAQVANENWGFASSYPLVEAGIS